MVGVRETELYKFVCFAGKILAKARIPLYSNKYSKRTYTQLQHLGVLCLKQKKKEDYRGIMELLMEMPRVRKALGLGEVPHWTTLQKFVQRFHTMLLDKLLMNIVKQFETVGVIAIDGSGFSSSYSSKYYVHRIRRKGLCRHFLKGSIAVDTATQLVTALRTRKSPSHDTLDFEPLLKKTSVDINTVLADKGYDSEANLKFVKSIGARPVIKIREGQSTPSRTRHRKRMLKGFDDPVVEKLYNHRALVETVYSSVKRGFGDTLHSRSMRLRKKELKLKFIAYNVHRGVVLMGGTLCVTEVFYRALKHGFAQ